MLTFFPHSEHYTPNLVQQAMCQFDEVWMGSHCHKCQRRKFCGDPIAGK